MDVDLILERFVTVGAPIRAVLVPGATARSHVVLKVDVTPFNSTESTGREFAVTATKDAPPGERMASATVALDALGALVFLHVEAHAGSKVTVRVLDENGSRLDKDSTVVGVVLSSP